MRRRALDAVPMVDATLARFRIHVEILQVVVEVYRTGAEVSSQKRGVSGEDGGHIYPSLFGQG